MIDVIKVTLVSRIKFNFLLMQQNQRIHVYDNILFVISSNSWFCFCIKFSTTHKVVKKYINIHDCTCTLVRVRLEIIFPLCADGAIGSCVKL